MAARGALFGPVTAGQTGSKKHLVEFRAGKMSRRGTMVHPDERKGLVYIHQPEDSLVHFCWKDRKTGVVEDDLIIFPEDAEMIRVDQCTTGRVFVLKFSSSNRRLFFWMQEPKDDKDSEYCKKVNETLNNPPSAADSASSSAEGGAGATDSDSAAEIARNPEVRGLLQSMGLGQLSDQQLTDFVRMMGEHSAGGGGGGLAGLSSLLSSGRNSAASVTPSESANFSPAAAATSTTPAAASRQSARQQIQLSDLQNILGAMPAAESPDPIDLAEAIKPETLIQMLANAEVQDRLLPHLPEGESLPSTEEELKQTVHSPQFRQALSTFSAALRSGSLGPVMPQFGFNKDAVEAANNGDIEAFAKAVQKHEKGEEPKEKSEEDDEKKDEGHEKMDES